MVKPIGSDPIIEGSNPSLSAKYKENMIRKLNNWYDQSKEPERFYMFLIFVLFCITLTVFVPVIGWPLLIMACIIRILGAIF